MASELKGKAVKGIVWSAIERFGIQGINFFIMIVMARLLTPSDYGLVGMLWVFIAIIQMLVDSGFTQALVRKQDRTDLDFATVFYFNIVVSIALYIILFLSAPLIADFYEQPALCELTRVLGIVVVINSLAIVQRTILMINIDFKTLAKISIIATVISGGVGLWMAFSGYGVWSLVGQNLLNAVVSLAILWIIGTWKPALCYSWESFRDLFSFGSKLMISAIINTVWTNIYPLIVGKIFSANVLGQYTRASHFAEFPSSNLTQVLQRVTFPLLCNIQNDTEKLRVIYRRFIRVSVFVVFPLMIGLSACAKPLINVMIGSNWDYCAVLLSIVCFSMMWYPMHSINLNLLQVMGRSDLFLKLEIIKKVFGVIVLCISVPFGIEAMCYGSVLSSIVSLIINAYYTGKLIGCGFWIQLKDVFHILSASLIMWVGGRVLTSFFDEEIWQLCMGIVVCFVLYCGISIVFKFPELKELVDIVKNR